MGLGASGLQDRVQDSGGEDGLGLEDLEFSCAKVVSTGMQGLGVCTRIETQSG